MCGNGKMRLVIITLGKEGGRIKKYGGGCAFNHDIL
jgi:hypothetical protein